MTRGGFVASSIAVAGLAEAIGDVSAARHLICEALAIGNLDARGRRQFDAPPRPIEGVEIKMVLRDISSTRLVHWVSNGRFLHRFGETLPKRRRLYGT